MIKDLVVIGSGGVDIVRLIEDINADKLTYNFLGFLEKDESKIGTEVLGYPVIGNDDLLSNKLNHCSVINNVIATTQIHDSVTRTLREKYHINDFPNLIHPSSISRYTRIGYGNIIYEHVNFGVSTSIGSFNILYPNVSIGHETQIGSYNLLALNVNIGARCTVGDKNLFANASVISLGLKIGDDNMIGVGSVLINDLNNGKSVLGNPAVDSLLVLKKHFKVTKGIIKEL